jgi:hypothetical protein
VFGVDRNGNATINQSLDNIRDIVFPEKTYTFFCPGTYEQGE